MIPRPSSVRAPAAYCESRVPAYQSNPLILALGPLVNDDGLFEALGKAPDYESKWRKLSPEERTHLLPDCRGIVYPLPDTFKIFKKLSVMIRHGYKDRNPMDAGCQQKLLALEELPHDLRNLSVAKASRNHSMSGLITGISGTGKTTVIEAFIDTFPPGVYVHTEFQGRKINCVQVPFVIVENDPKGSLIGLLESILDELERLTGDNQYLDLRKNYTLHHLIPHVVKQLVLNSVGMVFVDEAEYVKAQFNGGDAGMLFTWIHLMNSTGVPLVLLANPEIEQVFEKWLKASMRFSAGCRVKIHPLQRGEQYDEFLDAVWEYQYTKKKTHLRSNPLEEEIRYQMHYHSQGILRLILDLYRWTQDLAIERGGDEIITPRLIQEAAEINGHEIEPLVRVIAGNKSKELANYRDLGKPVARPMVPAFTPTVFSKIVESDGTPKPPASPPQLRRGKVKPTGYLSYMDVRVRGDYSTYALMKADGIIGDCTEFWLQ
jgi:hypothetical protein